MNRGLIEQIFAKIDSDLVTGTTPVPVFKKRGLFNDDFNKHDTGEGRPINFPAIFLSFPEDVTYLNSGSGVQKTDTFIVRFYIGEKFATEKSVLDIFDLKQDVFSVFHKWQPSGASSMTRVSETSDEDRPGYYVFIQDYEIKIVDDTKFVCKGLTEVNDATLRVDTDLKIDSNTVSTIRTDKAIQR